jgi:hypothetical protein
MKIFNIAIFLILLIGGVLAAVPTVSQLSYDPSPAVPGTTITALVQIENLDPSDKEDVYVSIDESYPFTVKGENERNIGNLEARGKTITYFEIYVDPTAQNQTYELDIRVKEDKSNVGIIYPRNIVVSGNDPLLKVVSISEPKLIPGQEKELVFEIQNIGTSTAYDIAVELEEDRTVTAAGEVVEREITPLGSATGYIEKLHAGEKEMVTIEVGVNREADLKNYTLPVVVSHRTPSGEREEETSYIGFKISGPVLMDGAIKESPTLISGSEYEVDIELFNKGAGKAEFTIVNIETDFGNVDRSKQFIGSLEPNDVDSFTTVINVNSDETKTGIIKLTIDYQDADAIKKEQVLEIPVQVYTAADGAALTPINPVSIIINIIILLVIVVVGYKGYQKYVKK